MHCFAGYRIVEGKAAIVHRSSLLESPSSEATHGRRSKKTSGLARDQGKSNKHPLYQPNAFAQDETSSPRWCGRTGGKHVWYQSHRVCTTISRFTRKSELEHPTYTAVTTGASAPSHATPLDRDTRIGAIVHNTILWIHAAFVSDTNPRGMCSMIPVHHDMMHPCLRHVFLYLRLLRRTSLLTSSCTTLGTLAHWLRLASDSTSSRNRSCRAAAEQKKHASR